jgi:outer membrane protein OmpA-like peptidoglycan-associated protein
MRHRAWRVPLIVATVLVLAVPVRAPAQDEAVPQSIGELKAALAELRRRLAERDEQAGSPEAAADLRAARRQVERLTVAMAALRRERDGLRAELLAVRRERERLLQVEGEQNGRLAASGAEIEQLRQRARPRITRLASPDVGAPAAVAPTTSEVLDGGAFAPGSAVLLPEASARLAEIATRAAAVPRSTIVVEGRSAANGAFPLAAARTQAVRDYLASRLGNPADGLASGVADRRVVITLEP